jgi:hypothetical protein
MTLRKILLIFSVGLVGNWAVGQKLSIETIIDTNKIVIGDQISVTYNILKKKNTKLQLPILNQKLIDGIEIIGQPTMDSTDKSGSLEQISFKLIITSFDTGMYYIPPQPFVILSSGPPDTIRSKATYLEVVGVAIDTTHTIRDIKAPENVPVTFREILPYLLMILVLALIVLTLVYFFRKHKKEVFKVVPEKPEEPAYITALRELDKITSQKLWQQKQVKEYYTRITYVIRWYISKRFAILALEMTSDEILVHLKSIALDQVNFHNLENLLNLADIVKFAKGEPEPEDNIIHLDNAYEFVKLTKEKLAEEIVGKGQEI